MDHKLLWLDLETTGLNPSKDKILEISCRVSDFNNPFIVDDSGHPSWILPLDPSLELNDYVKRIHSNNGLLKECYDAWNENSNYEQAISRIENMLLAALGTSYKYTLAGSTVSFDRAFLNINMPKLAKLIHYRNYDITSLKLFCQSFGMPEIAKNEIHRAYNDIKESINHAVQCKEWLKHNAGLFY